MTWTGVVLMTGWLEISASQSGDPQSNSELAAAGAGESQRPISKSTGIREKNGDPHEVFYKSCYIAFRE
jgi:hypothetical protein